MNLTGEQVARLDVPLSWRAAFGTVTPSTNRVIEPDFASFCPPGVTLHIGRSQLDQNIALDPDDGDAAFAALVKAIDAGVEPAMKDVLTCRPDYLAMGMSIETFWDGGDGAERYRRWIESLSEGLGVTLGSFAVLEALERFSARRVALVCPYFPIAAKHIGAFLSDHEIELVRWEALECASAHAMATVSEARLAEALKRLDGPDIEAIVQTGGNMSMVRLADAAERFLGKPVIAINTAIMWHALRAVGITDRFEGLGSLVREF